VSSEDAIPIGNWDFVSVINFFGRFGDVVLNSEADASRILSGRSGK